MQFYFWFHFFSIHLKAVYRTGKYCSNPRGCNKFKVICKVLPTLCACPYIKTRRSPTSTLVESFKKRLNYTLDDEFS